MLERKRSIVLTYKVSGWVTTSYRSQLQPCSRTCEGQCLPLCIRATQTLLQHPALLCGICYCLLWGFEVFQHVHTVPWIRKRAAVLLFFFHAEQKKSITRRTILEQKRQLEKTKTGSGGRVFRSAVWISNFVSLEICFSEREPTEGLSQLELKCMTSLTRWC